MALVRHKLNASNLQALYDYYEAEEEGRNERAAVKPQKQSYKADLAQKKTDTQWIIQKFISAQRDKFQYSLTPSDSATRYQIQWMEPRGTKEELERREQTLKDFALVNALYSKYEDPHESDDEAVEYPSRKEFEDSFNLVEWWLERCDKDTQDDSKLVTVVGGEQMKRPMLDVLPWQGFCADRSMWMESDTSSSGSETSTSSFEASSRRSPINLGSLLDAENDGSTSIRERPSERRSSPGRFMFSSQRSVQRAQKFEGQDLKQEGTAAHQPSIAARAIQASYLSLTETSLSSDSEMSLSETSSSSYDSEKNRTRRRAFRNKIALEAQGAKPVRTFNEPEKQEHSVPSITKERRARRAANRMDKHRREERERYWARRD